MARRRTTLPTSTIPTVGRKHAAYEIATRYNGIGHIPTEQVATHIDTLTGYGLSHATIARDAGVQLSSVIRIAERLRATSKVRVATRILAVTWTPNPRQEMVLAIGALRRLQALAAIGWSQTAISDRTGVTRSVLNQLKYARTTSWETWVAIRDTYETLSATPATTGRLARVRGEALRRGWPAPLDWEGHNIDDPCVIVEAHPYEPKSRIDEIREAAAVRAERVAELTALGLSAKEVAQRVGITPRQVVRDRGATAVAAA